MIKTRFAPSPTGHLHLGNVRTALFSWLIAKKHHGHFVLRIEDTDAERSQDEHIDTLCNDLRWLGLDWQEGPQVNDADNGPYRQSQRSSLYADYYARLETAGQAYACFCSKEKLAQARAAQRAAGKPPRYPGTCARLDPAEAKRRLEAGEKATLRFRVSAGDQIQFTDLVRGPQTFASDDIGDFVIRRTDGTPAFFFSNAIDDALMGITHVLRGEDHLTNTPRQLLLLQALDLPLPGYGHLPLVLAAGGGPLSKREGAASLQYYQAKGVKPLALANYLARLGHHFSNDDFMSFADLADGFDLAHVGKAPAHFDSQQLEHWQREAVLKQDDAACAQWLDKALARVPKTQRTALATALQPNVLYPFEAAQWADILFGPGFYYSQPARDVLQNAGTGFFDTAIQAVENNGDDYPAVTAALKETGVKGKNLFQPLRFAVTGRKHGPELAALFTLLGKERLIEKLQRARQESQ
ncbi:MAG TPA: glutamate--tRNA ligase [Gammaproteobacteria bacterium]|nr:glutamate--tRNA ligase [Gammaproteobacteria bacterium]